MSKGYVLMHINDEDQPLNIQRDDEAKVFDDDDGARLAFLTDLERGDSTAVAFALQLLVGQTLPLWCVQHHHRWGVSTLHLFATQEPSEKTAQTLFEAIGEDHEDREEDWYGISRVEITNILA